MSFFDDRPEDTPAQPQPPQQLHARTGPPWMGRPAEYFLPALLPWTQLLGRSDDTVAALRGVQVWPDSCTFDVVIFARRSLLGDRPAYLSPARDPDGLRFGVLFADGRRATNRDQHPWQPGQEPPAGPILNPGGGGGSSFSFHFDFHVWPLPPAGPLNLIVEWPSRGITETWTELDTAPILTAATEAVEIWPDLPPPPEGTTFGTGWATAVRAQRSTDLRGGQ